MKIVYDYQIFQAQKFGGISRYFFELLRQYQALGTVTGELPIRYSENEYLASLPAFRGRLQPLPPPPPKQNPYRDFLGGWHFKGKWQLYSLKQKLFPPLPPPPDPAHVNREGSIARLRAGNFDVFHPTYYDGYFLEHLGGKPYVLTVYDMIHEVFPEYFVHGSDAAQKRLLVKGAARIIAISESTKRDVVQLLGAPPEKVDVIYLGSSLEAPPAGREAPAPAGLPARYLLFVGNRGLYKNFYFFVTAIAPLLEADRDLHIVCTGAALDGPEKQFLGNYGLQDRVFHVFADDATLAALYRNAVAFVFPSQYEGFGIPVLEAFACGCPVLVSNTSSLPEVGGDAVRYFAPKDAASIRAAVAAVLESAAYRAELAVKGRGQLAKFSWEQMAKQTREVYRRVLAGQ